MLNKRVTHIGRKMDAELKSAQAAKDKGDKAGAMLCMKRRKALEGQRNMAMNAITNLESQQAALEQMIVTREIVGATQVIGAAIQGETALMSADKVDQIMDAAEEGMADVREITEAANRSMDNGLDLDEDDLMAELNGLSESGAEQQLIDELKDTGIAPMPVPNHGVQVPLPVPTTKVSEEDAELKRLEAEMGM